ncbi:MAG: ECF transporter S component [Ruminiclostridium sp.]|nr:ECF transporter S component [Ruminiclostridium sp.]MBQ9853308.1 ECF transporter S component [Ruminiclostridium sp.]MBQ9932510.1 ECF transporter S component [Ruminiclostridium sp.]
MNTIKKFSTRTLVLTGMLAAVAGVLMSFEFSVPMMPPFYKVDLSDLPSVIALFSLGPWPAACVEVVKLLIKLVTVGTNTMYVGELANLLGIALFVVPTWLIYKKLGKTRKAAIAALAIDLPIRIAFSCFLNACITLPLYAKAMGLSLNEVVMTVGAVNPLITNLPLFIILATIPFNLIKVALNYFLGYLLYDKMKDLRMFKGGMPAC